MGNLRSVSKALEHLGAEVKVSSEASDIERAAKVVFPGVGAFGDAILELKKRMLLDPVRRAILEGKPFLAICLGIQLLFDESEESPGIAGFGIFPGKVRAFRSKIVKIPHMGWNQIKIERNHPMLRGVADGSYFYFVHSFYGVPEDPGCRIGSCQYGDENFTAIAGNETVFATQFHPEKSQKAGLAILKNFVSWKP